MPKNQYSLPKKEKTKISWFYLFRKFTSPTLIHYVLGAFSAFLSSKILVELGNILKVGDLSYVKSNWVEILFRLIIYTLVVYSHIAWGVFLEELYSSHLREKLAQKYLQANFSQTQKAKFILSNYESDAVTVGVKATQIFNRSFYGVISIFLVFLDLREDEKIKIIIPWLLLALLIITATAVLLYQLAYHYRIRRIRAIQRENKHFEEIKDNVEYVKINGAEKKEISKNKRLIKNGTKNMLFFALSKSLYATIPNYSMLKYLPVILLFFVQAWYWSFVYLWLADLFENWKKVFEMLWAYGGYDAYCASLKQLNNAFAILEKDADSPAENFKKPSLAVKSSVSFQNVVFIYPKTSAKILDNFSFNFQSGKKYVIIGPNGVGKSTLFKLIVKLYKPQQGVIKLNNIELEKIDNSALRQRIIYLPSHPYFFNTSLGDNVVYPENYQENIHKEKLEKIAKKLGIKEFVDKLPNRWEFVVAEKGRNLSGGQKQLISLMRTLVKDYEVYLFDEFLSNVSSELKKKILKTIFSELKNKTVIFISHDGEALQYADEIYKLTSRGIIKEN